eukprot:CAMPEP_0185165392 /NCGR_PEP_ID=MMETSP1139-20130426/10815_1 /TAXON_ID=298111 /ORGANISM="Pavlova sp., Strain CCMP459" /LENGTH=138 /DNA_ID=CAMNT_0027730789 /DNA_START=169 /DNA_END=586 /DNA_ORIENTATION=+
MTTACACWDGGDRTLHAAAELDARERAERRFCLRSPASATRSFDVFQRSYVISVDVGGSCECISAVCSYRALKLRARAGRPARGPRCSVTLKGWLTAAPAARSALLVPVALLLGAGRAWPPPAAAAPVNDVAHCLSGA